VLTSRRVDDRTVRSHLTDGTDGEPTEWSKAFACKHPPLQAAVQSKWLCGVAVAVGGRVVAFFNTPASCYCYCYTSCLEEVLAP
jgi:hypothetical protein